jgi:competence protein ComEC
MQESTKPGMFTNRPALVAAFAYSLGICLGIYLKATLAIVISLLLVVGFAGLYFHLKRKANIAAVFLYSALILCGLLQYRLAVDNFPPSHIKKIAENGGNTAVIGKIVEEPDIRIDKTYLTIEVDSLMWRKRQFASSGKILIKINQPTNAFSFGDYVKLDGYLFSPGEARVPGGFDYARYLANDEIFAMMVLENEKEIEIRNPKADQSFWQFDRHFINGVISPLRKIYIDGYHKYLPSELASLLAGLTLGEKRDISPEIARLFSDTGTLHLMAVSGSNVAIVAGFFIWALAWANRRARIIITLGAVIFFSFLTRNEPSVVRATVMAAVGLIGYYRKRNADMMGLLGFAGLIILIWRPLWLFSVGFQLSIAASAGIIYFVPKFDSKVNLKRGLLSKILRILVAAVVTTVAAQIAVLPITAQYLQRLPMAGLIANLPMILLAGILTIAGILFLPFILIGGVAGSIYATLLNWMLSIIQPLLGFFANLPYAVIDINPPGVLKIIAFFAISYFISEYIFIRRISIKAGLVTATVFVASLALYFIKGPAEESLSFIDCGVDRAVLYHTAKGHNYLWYDCHEEDSCQQFNQVLIPYLGIAGINEIDTVFTGNRTKIGNLSKRRSIGNILQYADLKYGDKADTLAVNPYLIREFILTDNVNVGQILSDNNKELITGGIFFNLNMAGGKCVLAGNMVSLLADGAIMPAALIELPWSVQPYGIVYEKLKINQPQIIVFSPGNYQSVSIGKRAQLTYLSERVWATSLVGSFRVRFEESNIRIDHMVEPR